MDAQGEPGDLNYYFLDRQIDDAEEKYKQHGLDYWMEPKYHEKGRALKKEPLENWE